MSEAIKDYTPSGKIKRPSYSLVANWVKEGWDAIDINMIRRSFKCCGISNATDGTEDTLIFDFNRLEDKVNREDPRREIDLERDATISTERNVSITISSEHPHPQIARGTRGDTSGEISNCIKSCRYRSFAYRGGRRHRRRNPFLKN